MIDAHKVHMRIVVHMSGAQSRLLLELSMPGFLSARTQPARVPEAGCKTQAALYTAHKHVQDMFRAGRLHQRGIAWICFVRLARTSKPSSQSTWLKAPLPQLMQGVLLCSAPGGKCISEGRLLVAPILMGLQVYFNTFTPCSFGTGKGADCFM
eukprot:1154015-Pelagomonas_calceolata.AAC.9